MAHSLGETQRDSLNDMRPKPKSPTPFLATRHKAKGANIPTK